VSDDQAILISDMFPTAWFGARLAEVGPGDSVLVLGAGAVGQFAVAAPEGDPGGEHWVPGDAPSLALQWAVEAAAKASSIGIIGVYPAQFRSFPIGAAMNKNLTVKMGHLQPTPIPARPARPRGRGHDRPHRVHHPA
jgi:threonine dehydrogenase-like Zn-dependent dehydrogenase